ncbi:hypothetical protein IFM89_035304 [Coptis chinensis]|uniref:Uncharacterized protein n=1 Tax=Coptis chinensis TaxID=261450 RepID=A0A835IKI2_9MAGN|nr:hypothetical protein IFM89_035304 [Coptis chinensis]
MDLSEFEITPLARVRGDQPQHLDVEDLPTPEIKGNMPSIKLPKKAVERGRLYCKYCLVEKEAVIPGPVPNARKLNKKRRRNKDKQHAGTSGTKDSTGDYISTPPIATQPTAIDVEPVNMQVNATVNEDNNVGEQDLQEAQAAQLMAKTTRGNRI